MQVEITRWKTSTKENKHRKGSIKKKEVRIDYHDSWSVAWSLAQIAAPLVKQLKETAYSYGSVPKHLVPEHLHSTYGSAEEHMEDYSKEAWDWALDEIVFAMEEIASEHANEPPMFSKEGEIVIHPIDESTGLGEVEFVGFETTTEIREQYKAYHERIQKGCELFGVVFRDLWS